MDGHGHPVISAWTHTPRTFSWVLFIYKMTIDNYCICRKQNSDTQHGRRDWAPRIRVLWTRAGLDLLNQNHPYLLFHRNNKEAKEHTSHVVASLYHLLNPQQPPQREKKGGSSWEGRGESGAERGGGSNLSHIQQQKLRLPTIATTIQKFVWRAAACHCRREMECVWAREAGWNSIHTWTRGG